MRALWLSVLLLLLTPSCFRGGFVFEDGGASDTFGNDARDTGGANNDVSADGTVNDGGVNDGGSVDPPKVKKGEVGSTACDEALCWVLPGPSGAGILDLYVAANGEIWAAAGTAYALRLENDTWVPYPLAAKQRLSTFWEQGTLHGMGTAGNWSEWTGTQWQTATPPVAGQDIRAACATGPDQLWAGGPWGLHELTSGGWISDEATAINDLLCIGTEIWRLTGAGVDHFDGLAWQPVFDVNQGSRLGGTGADDLWVAAAGGVVHWDGLAAQTQSLSHMLSDISLSGSERWVVGGYGFAARWNGSGWEEIPSGTDRDLNAVAIVAADDVWMGGDAGVLLHWDGGSLKPVNKAALNDYLDGWSASVDDIWLVGVKQDGSGLTYHWDGVSWTDVPNLATGGLSAIWGFGPDDVWAGSDDVLIHWDGAAWTAADLGEPAAVNALWGPASDDLWILRDAAIVRWDGSKLQPAPSLPSSTSAYATIWGASASDVWVTRSSINATVLYHYGGSGWEEYISTPGARTVVDLQGFSTDNIWGITREGATVHWDGTEWIRGGAGVGARAYAIGGPRPDLLVAVGIDGNLARFDGSSWTSLPKPNDSPWTEVVPAGDGVLVLGHGAVMWID